MKHSFFSLVLAASVAFTVGIGVARADVPPPDDYVEQCTIAKQQKPGETCVACQADYADTKACEKVYPAQGYTSRCKSWGASAWTEVWCKAGSATGGSSGTGGQTSSGGAATTGGSAASGASGSGDDGGCGCSFRRTSPVPEGLAALFALALGLRLIRKARD